MKKEKAKKGVVNVRSQSAQLQQKVKKSFLAMLLGGVLLALTIAASFAVSAVEGEQLETTMLLNQYRLGSKALTSAVQSFAVTGDTVYYEQYMKELNEDKNRDVAWTGLEKNDISAAEWDELNAIAELSNGLVPLEENAMKAAKGGNTQEAMDCVFGVEYEETVVEITDKTDALIVSVQERLAGKTTLIKTVQMIAQLIFIASFVFLVIQIFGTIKFAREELLKPIIKVSEQMTVLAEGNFHTEFDMTEDESEVGKMVSAINFMKQNLIGMIREISSVLEQMGQGNYIIQLEQNYVGEFIQIKESLIKICSDMKETLYTIREISEQIDSGSEQLAKAAEDLAEGSTIQAVEVQELAGLIHRVTESMEQNAVGAEESVAIASNAGETLNTGNQKMQDLKDAISEISKCSEEIGTIISAIEDIASQTNLLSLNAAIEAARAGEAGKGFAVVAEQVKNLAEESAKAAGETKQLIETTIQAVDKGIVIADETAVNMEAVMKGAKLATDKMGQMAVVLKQDVQNMNQINSSISHVSEVVDNNSATSEETAAVSEEQAAQVEVMVQMLDRFQL